STSNRLQHSQRCRDELKLPATILLNSSISYHYPQIVEHPLARSGQPADIGRMVLGGLDQQSQIIRLFPPNQLIDRCAMMAEHDFCKLLRLGAGELDYLGPLVGFFRDAPCVLAERQRKHLAAKVGNACLDLWVSEDGVDLPVERVDDFGGRVLRRADTGPRARLETRYEVAKWRDVGKRLQARRGGHRQGAQPAGPDVFYGGRHIVEHDMHLSGNEIG